VGQVLEELLPKELKNSGKKEAMINQNKRDYLTTSIKLHSQESKLLERVIGE
jgi:hypothetical protein